jgi:hypothetical protein
MLSVIMLSVIMLSVIMLSVIMLSVIMLSVIMLRVIMLILIMLNVILMSVVVPFRGRKFRFCGLFNDAQVTTQNPIKFFPIKLLSPYFIIMIS